MEKWKMLITEAMDYYQKDDLAMAEEKFMEAVKETELEMLMEYRNEIIESHLDWFASELDNVWKEQTRHD